jgi:pyruvate kinase
MHRIIFKQAVSESIHNSTHRKTNIVATIGLNNSQEFLGKLVKAGMNVMRVNCSHGDHAHHQKSVDNLRNHLKTLEKQKQVALMLDIRGPKIRTGMLENKEVQYEPGDEFTMKLIPTKEIPNFKGNKQLVYCDYLSFPKTVDVGARILMDDGLMEVHCIGKGSDFIKVQVKNRAILAERKGVLIPGAVIDLPAVSEKDYADLLFAAKNNFDFVAASFIRKAAQVREVRSGLGDKGKTIKIVSKIENQEGLDNIDEIIKETDAVMVARGDLGTELPPEKIFAAQKMIIERCNFAGKPVITATQMLESMTHYPTPTRAECTDVANAILDGSDCVMLSGETAKGKYPTQSIDVMSKICHEVEEHINYENTFLNLFEHTERPMKVSEMMAASAVKLAYETRAKLLFCVTETGDTARYMSKYRPPMPIISLTANPIIARQSLMLRGIVPYLIEESDKGRSIDELIKEAYNWSVQKGYIQRKEGDLAICVHDSNPWDQQEESNNLRIIKI